jgi:hypothetical protein
MSWLFLNKPFRFYTSLSVAQSKEKLTKSFPSPSVFRSNGVFLRSLSGQDSLISFTLMQSKIRGLHVLLDADIYNEDSNTIVAGYVRVSRVSLALLAYFSVMSLILFFAFADIWWLSLFFLLIFGAVVFYGLITFHNRRQIIDRVKLLLSDI